MTQHVGGSIGAKIAALAYHTALRTNTISLAVVTHVHDNMMKVDVALKNAKGTNVVELFNCPILSQSYQGGGQINIPRVGDMVVILYSKYNIEDQIKNGSLHINAIDEINVAEQNYAIVIGTIYPVPETTDNVPPDVEPKAAGEGDEDHRRHVGIYKDEFGNERNYFFPPSADNSTYVEPPYNRAPIYHDETVDRAQRFINERLKPQQDHQIWYHPYDHEIRMTREEIHIKHKSGSQIIFREPGDVVMHVVGNLNIHSVGNIIIESEQRADVISYCPPKAKPWRVE